MEEWADHNEAYKGEIERFGKDTGSTRSIPSTSLQGQREQQRKKKDLFDKYRKLFENSVGQLWIEQEASDSKRLGLLKESFLASGWDLRAMGEHYPVDKERLIDSWERCQRDVASIVYTVTYTNATKQRPFNDEGLSLCWEIGSKYLCDKKSRSIKQ